jgi:SNF family Na+-dependent transporter
MVYFLSILQKRRSKMEREHLGSRLGFILLSAGCAIGLGNVYRFPMKAGQYGGGAFVLVYVLCLVLLGLPVIILIVFVLGILSYFGIGK